MKALKNYGWTLKIVGAALLIGLALFLYFGNGAGIVVPIVGGAIIIYSGIRLVPFVKTQKNDLIKTINIIEITVDIGIGLVFVIGEIMSPGMFESSSIFGYLLGLFFMARGSVHFYGVSLKVEKSDFPLYLFHVLALIVGSFVFFYDGGFTAATLVWIILFFSVVSGGYLSFDGYKGYKIYRYQKTLQMPDIVQPQDDVVDQPAPVIEKEEPVQDQVVS